MTAPHQTPHHTGLRDQIASLLTQASAQFILPRYKQLSAAEQGVKGDGLELVTVADIETEAWLSARIHELVPGAKVIGEEAVATDPSLLNLVGNDGDLWVIDPVDGTRNFANGSRHFCIMLARLNGEQIVQSWVYLPLNQVWFYAAAGQGAWSFWHDTPPVQLRANQWTGLKGSFGRLSFGMLPPEKRSAAKDKAQAQLNFRSSLGCAGYEYIKLIEGNMDYALFNRAKVWDHVAGALLIREAGGLVRHFDGSDYVPTAGTEGVIAAASDEIFAAIREMLFAGD